MSDTPGPITWALDLLQAHSILPLAEGEDERRYIGQLNVQEVSNEYETGALFINASDVAGFIPTGLVLLNTLAQGGSPGQPPS